MYTYRYICICVRVNPNPYIYMQADLPLVSDPAARGGTSLVGGSLGRSADSIA